MLTYDQLQIAVAAAKRQYDRLRQKYPDLDQKGFQDCKAYLVFALPGGQVGIDASPSDILFKFPAMVTGGPKQPGAAILPSLRLMESTGVTGPDRDRLAKQWALLAPQLEYDGHCQVEIRFKNLNYETIGNLQVDELVDRNLTPQTKASIRIVLGTLAHFERTGKPDLKPNAERKPSHG